VTWAEVIRKPKAAGFVEVRSGLALADETIITDRLTSPLLPDFDLDVPQLFTPQ